MDRHPGLADVEAARLLADEHRDGLGVALARANDGRGRVARLLGVPGRARRGERFLRSWRPRRQLPRQRLRESSSSLASAAACADLARSIASGVLAASTALMAASTLAWRAGDRGIGVPQRGDRLVGLRRSRRRSLDRFLGLLRLGRRLGDDLQPGGLGPLERIEELSGRSVAGCGRLVGCRYRHHGGGLRGLRVSDGRGRQGGHRQCRVRELDRLHVLRRHDHTRAHPGHAPQLGCEAVRQADAAVRGRIARQHARVQRDAGPGDALHEGHRRAAVDVRAVVAVLLDHAEDPGRGREARHSRRDAALGLKAAGAMHRDALLRDRDNDKMRQRRGLGLLLLHLPGRIAGSGRKP